MAKVIAVLNPKGGCGKTTLSIHLAHTFALQGERVLLVDSDPQGSARDWREAVPEGAPGAFPVIGIDRPTIDQDLSSLTNDVDWVLIDGAAKLEKMIASAVKAADLILIPVQPSPLDIWACSSLVELIHARHAVTDGHPTSAFQIHRAKKGTQLAREVTAAVGEYGLPILNGAIHDRTVFARSMADGGTALTVEPSGQAAWEINHLVKQLREAFA